MKAGESMNKAAISCGLLQATVHARFKKFPHLYNLQNEDEEEEMDIDELDVSIYNHGRGRPNDLPEDMEAALAKEIEKAIRGLNAPTTRAVLKILVKKVLFVAFFFC